MNKPKSKGKIMPKSARPGNIGRTALFLQNKALTKDLAYAKDKAALWFLLVKRLAAELYTINPNHKVFIDNTFVDSTKILIKQDSKECIVNCEYSKIIYFIAEKPSFEVNITELKKQISKDNSDAKKVQEANKDEISRE